MHFLGCLIFLLFGVIFIVIALFGNVLRLLFGMRKATKKFQQAAEEARKGQFGQQKDYTETTSKATHTHHQRKEGEKIFPKNEGEYVDFEEIKE